jgi:seryl-tRNA synthetase
MYDIEKIRENPEWLDKGLAKRGIAPLSAEILKLDIDRRALQTSLQEAMAKRNDLSRQIGEIKKSGGNADDLMAQVAALKEQVPADEAKEAEIAEKLNTILFTYPNIPLDEVPIGADEEGNIVVFKFMEPTKFDFEPKDHVELGEKLGLLDFPAAVRMSGSRFFVTKGALSRLERAMNLYALDMLTTEFGYTEVTAPFLVNEAAAFGVGMLPKFEEDMFKTDTGHYLISTSEVSITNLVMDQILEPKQFPLRYTSYSPCFRSEAGSAGKDTRGLIRVHQFTKVEQVVICAPEQAQEEHERMTSIAEQMLQRLKLPYIKKVLCTGDMGFASQKTYDIDTWVPTQGTYRETMSCSNMGDFQARRMKARYKPEGSKKTEFVYTLNATCIATPRALVAVIENYQQADGSIKVPDVLIPYMNGLEVIK